MTVDFMGKLTYGDLGWVLFRNNINSPIHFACRNSTGPAAKGQKLWSK